MTNTNETKRNFPKGIGFQRNKVILTLSNSELDALESVFRNDKSEMGEHINASIRKCRRSN